MGRFADKELCDSVLEHIRVWGGQVSLCKRLPRTFAQATDTQALGVMDVSPDMVSAPYDTEHGRAIDIGSDSWMRIHRKGIATHAAIVDPIREKLLLVTECRELYLNRGDKVALGPWKIESGLVEEEG